MGRYIAVDLGAESGRVMVGALEGGMLLLDEVHRFANGAVQVRGSHYWDVLHLFAEIKAGIARAAQKYGPEFAAIGVDTWGIDFALLDAAGDLVANPHTYRDPRTAGVLDEVLAEIPAQEIYAASGGIQFMSINTLYQLRAMVRSGSWQLANAATFLMMPDLFNYWLSGVAAVEYTNATSTQAYDSRARDWAWALLQKLEIPITLFPGVVLPGSVLGPMLPEIAAECGVAAMPVVAIASHDTASAVMAVPAESDEYLWLSSGTWSLLGVVAETPLVSSEALAANVSSYGGAGGKVLPWRNIMGLWLLQECRHVWEREGKPYTYEQLASLALGAPPFVAVLDPDDPAFLAPASMPEAIREFCVRTGQPAPADHASTVRTILESLALRYRWVTERLEALTHRTYPTLHIVGGGSQNGVLCQFAADALSRTVVAGPVEATALGNVALQAVALGEIASIADARALIRRGAAVRTFECRNAGAWEEPYRRFCRLVDKGN